jgi:hypothetical protein
MAWRLNEMVTRGVIDNRKKGKVTGTLWLIGQEPAIRLELDGNCDDDLAGCLVEFVNHKPRPDPSIGQFRDQVGAAGAITASRKVRTLPPDVPAEELSREMIERLGWSNSLYLEWFSNFNGRVVVELVDPEIRVSEPTWSFAADEKAERRKLAEEGEGFVHMIKLDELPSHPTSFCMNKRSKGSMTMSSGLKSCGKSMRAIRIVIRRSPMSSAVR